jgi:hypothetical protein
MTSPIILSFVAASLLTPIVITLWSRTFPPALLGEMENKEELHKRNGWIDSVATIFMFAGMFLPFLLFRSNFNSIGIWAIGLMLGLSVSFHFIWVCLATLPFGGVGRFREFWRFYEIKWGIAMNGIRFVYIPISLIGLVSIFKIWS